MQDANKNLILITYGLLLVDQELLLFRNNWVPHAF
jgi:hypothetical protein